MTSPDRAARPSTNAVIESESRLEAALGYAKRGFAVLPLHSPIGDACSCGKDSCSSVGKDPRTRHGVKDATTDEATITGWYEKWADANLGIATGQISDIVVLDIDASTGKDGPLSLEHLEQEYGKLPDTVSSITGGGGVHLFFRWPGQRIGNRTNLRPGIDFRGDGGYVVAPPSVHVSGEAYVWEASSSLDCSKLADMPPWLLHIVHGPSKNGSRPTTRSERPDSTERGAILDGTRNVSLASMGGAMRAVGFDQWAIRNALLNHNAVHCKPPKDEAEVAKIAASLARYAPNVPKAGGVFLCRDLPREKRLWARPRELRLFLYLLFNAAWTERERGTGNLEIGELRRSVRRISRECAWTENNRERKWGTSTVKALIENLEKMGLIEVLGTELETHIQVVNYEQYRGIPTGTIGGFERDSEQL